MPEQGEASSKIKIDPRWGSGKLPESDINPYEAQRLRASGGRSKKGNSEEIKKIIRETRAKLSQPAEIITTSKPKPFTKELNKIPEGFGR